MYNRSYLPQKVNTAMWPALLLSVSIAALLVRTEPHIIVFAMLVMMPCAIAWWMIGWKAAVVYLAGYLAFRALLRWRGHFPLQ